MAHLKNEWIQWKIRWFYTEGTRGEGGRKESEAAAMVRARLMLPSVIDSFFTEYLPSLILPTLQAARKKYIKIKKRRKKCHFDHFYSLNVLKGG